MFQKIKLQLYKIAIFAENCLHAKGLQGAGLPPSLRVSTQPSAAYKPKSNFCYIQRELLVQLLLIILLIGSLTACKPIELIDTQGNHLSTKDWQNKWVIVNYWASWCGPCQVEIPELNQFYRLHGKQVVLIGVNYDDLQLNALQLAVQKLHIEFPVLQHNPAQALRFPSMDVIPFTFIINPNGKLVKTLIGPQTVTTLEQATQIHG